MSEERLIYLMNHYSPTGASHFSHVIPLLEEMGRQGTEVLLLIEKATAPPELNHPNVQVRFLPSGSSLLGRTAWLLREISSGRRSGYRTVFVRISSWSALAAIYALRGRRGDVYFWQSGTTIEFDSAQPVSMTKIRWLLLSHLPSRLVWKFTDYFVTGPETMVDYYSTVGRVDRRKIRVLYNDVQFERFSFTDGQRAELRDRLRRSLQVPPDGVCVLFVHRLSPVRRTLDYLPLALERVADAGLLRNTYLLVAGGGGDLDELRRRTEAKGLGRNVRFIGEVPNFGIESLYAACDVFIQPSHAEGFPRVMLEAMAAGLPLVSTDAGGSGDLVGRVQSHYVVDKADPEAFASALVALLGAPETWAQLAAENRSVARRFDTPLIASMYRKVLFHD